MQLSGVCGTRAPELDGPGLPDVSEVPHLVQHRIRHIPGIYLVGPCADPIPKSCDLHVALTVENHRPPFADGYLVIYRHEGPND